MKKIYTTFILLFAILMLSNGQIKLTSKLNSFREGDSHDFIFMNNLNEGNSGENVIWDFSSLLPNKISLTSHMNPTSTNEKSKEISEANLILEEFGNQFLFKVNSDGMFQYGVISGNSVTKYNKPITKLKFPFKYGEKVVGNYSGVQQNENSSTQISGTFEVVADAFGTLLLPNNIQIENVLRVRQTRTVENANNSGFQEITYRWYAEGIRYPILVIIKYVTSTSSTISQTALYTHTNNNLKSAKPSTVSELYNSDVKIDVFPNPYSEELNITYTIGKTSKVTIETYDETGRLLKTNVKSVKQDAGLYSLKLNASETTIKSGITYIRFTIDNNIIVKKVVKY